MKYAVISTSGKQYRVKEGDVIEVDRVKSSKNDKISFEDVLLFVSDGQVKVGKPTLSGVNVEGKVIDEVKGDKIRVQKYKAKVRYRRTTGFRSKLTLIKIEKIEAAPKADKAVKKSK